MHHALRCDLMSISPKLSNSTPHERDGGRWAVVHERLSPSAGGFEAADRANYEYQLKFVVSDARDLCEIRRIQDELSAPAARIMLMPEGVTREVVAGTRDMAGGTLQEARVSLQPASAY